jgi:uncharacterized protein involved in exopolysaccharide biosynthesis/Mrp family chromosome partitioning ATPase
MIGSKIESVYPAMPAIRSATTTRGGIDVPALLAAVRRALPTLVVVAALVGALAYLLLDRLTPLYRAEARLAVGIAASNAEVRRNTLAAEVQLIRSRDLGEQVIASLGLGDTPEYRAAAEGSAPFNDFLVMLGLARDLRALSPEERVFALYDDNLGVDIAGKPPAIRIAFWAADPVLAAQAAGAVADAYVALRQSATDEATVLAGEITRLQEAIAAAEARASELRGGPAEALDDAERAALVRDRDAARADLDAARTDAAAIRASLAAEAIPDVPAFRQNPAVRALIDEQAALRAELGREITANPLGNPRIAEIGARLGQIHGMLEAEAVRLAEALDASAAALAARITGIETQLVDADAADAAAQELAGLEQSIASDRDRLQAALHRQAALTQGGMLPTNVRVVANAQIPRAPEWPPVETLTAIAFAAALLAGIAIVLLREIVTGGAFRRAPFEPLAELDVPSPAEGRVRPDEREMGRAKTDDPTLAPEIDAEASLGEVADSVAGRRRIIVTLAEDSDGDGRPLAAVALARALASRDRTVVLVDLHADGANPTAMGEVDDLVGFSDLLAGKASFAETIFRDRRSRAHFIPVGSRRLAPEALAGERLATLLTALDHTYDHVVVDCPDDAIGRIAPGADAALVTSEYGSADPRTVRAVTRIARVSDAHIFHLVVAPTRQPPETAEAA